MSAEHLRSLARPALMFGIIAMLAPFALLLVVIEIALPGRGVAAANVALEWVRGLPDTFWTFAGLATLAHQASRSFDKAQARRSPQKETDQ